MPNAIPKKMDAYIDEILNDMPDYKAALTGLVRNIMDEDIPEDVKRKLLTPLRPAKAPRAQRKKLKAPKEEIWQEFDPLFHQAGPGILDDKKYYTLFVGGAHRLFPNGEPTQLGKRITARTYGEIRELGEAGHVELQPTVRGPDIKEDGSVWWVSHERLELRGNTLLPQVLEMLDPDRRYRLFTVVGKAPTEPLAPISEEEGRSQHKMGGSLVKRGDKITQGALEGIDAGIWEKGREYLIYVRYELRPLPEQNGEPGPMFEPDNDDEFANCVVRYVADWLRNKCTLRSRGLTKKRSKVLETFDEKLATTGCTKEDLFRLEKKLEIKLVAVDALGNVLWDSGKYAKKTTITIPCHNNHAWSELPTDPPAVTSVHGLDAEAERELQALYRDKCLTSASVKTREAKIREALLRFVSRAIPRGTRIWLCGHAIVTHEGHLYRPSCDSKAIDRAFADETGQDPQWIPEDNPAWNEYIDATHSMGGAIGYRFKKWLQREKIKPTPPKYREVWQAAQVEAKVWNSKEDYGKLPHNHIDMRAAYLGCEDSAFGGVSDAIDLVREYGFPTDVYRSANVEGRPLMEVLRLTGAVQIVEWEFSQNCHPYTSGRIAQHLRNSNGWITTPELKDLIESGDLISAKAREVLYSVGKKDSIRFPSSISDAKDHLYPEGRDLAVRFVGKCARHADETSIVVRDREEAAYLTNLLAGTDHLLNFEQADGVHLIQYKDGKRRCQWFHIRAFVLAYTNIALRRMLRRFPRNDVLRVCTDAIYATTVPQEVERRLVGQNPRYGEWRYKKSGYEWRPEADWQPDIRGSLAVQPSTAPNLPADLEAATSARLYLTGQGGSGKTEWAVKMFEGRNIVVLTPENDLADDHRNNPRLCQNGKPLNAQTYHHYLCIPADKPIEDWDPVSLGMKLSTLAEVIVIDECCKIQTKVLRTMLEYLATRPCQVVCSGDFGQVPPWGDKEGPHGMLAEWAGAKGVRCFESDYRCTCETCGRPYSVCEGESLDSCSAPVSRLHDIKCDIWRQSDSQQLGVFRREWDGLGFNTAVSQTRPGDMWVCSTNKMGARVQERLLDHHKNHYSTCPAKIRFDPDPSIAHRYRTQGRPVPVPGFPGRTVNAYKGTVVQVPLDAVLRGLPLEWKYAGWGTVHRVQGKTIQQPHRLYMVDHSLEGWITNAVYTGISRVRHADQIVRVLPPDNAPGPVVPSELQATPNQDLILARIKRYATEDRQKGRPKYTGSYHTLTVNHVLDIITSAQKKCTVCGIHLLLQDYTKCHPQCFSIDRIDDAQGHYKWNVRLTCLSCNRRHKR